jgi:hypothetical protein
VKRLGRPPAPAAEDRAICSAVYGLLVQGCPPKRAFELVADAALERWNRGRDDPRSGKRRPLSGATIKEIYETRRVEMFGYPGGPDDAGSYSAVRRHWDFLEKRAPFAFVSSADRKRWRRPRGKPLTRAELTPWLSLGDARPPHGCPLHARPRECPLLPRPIFPRTTKQEIEGEK